jgi:hypothetical protein
MRSSRSRLFKETTESPPDSSVHDRSYDRRDKLFDYSAGSGGQLEVDNIAGSGSQLREEMSGLLQSEVIPNEVHAPLPRQLKAAQEEGMADFYARSAELAL